MAENKEYYAFISYKREDEKWAKWLQDKLEHYRFPTNLNGRTDLPKNIRPTFRDVTDLKPGLLAEEISNALHNSQWLIVVCSPRSAKSPWVCKEAQTFIDLGREDHIIPFVIEGNPFSNDTATECYPDSLRNLTGGKELLAANINEMGRDAAVIKVVARMFGLRFDTLWQRHERDKRRRRNWIITTITFFLLAVLSITLYISHQNNLLRQHISRVASSTAERLIEKDDIYSAMKVSLCALDIAYTIEAESALRNSNAPTLKTILCQLNEATSISFSSDGEKLVSTSIDSTIRIWAVASGKCLKTFKEDYLYAQYALFSPNGEYLAAISFDKIVLWNILNNHCVAVIPGYFNEPFHAASFSPDSKRLAFSATNDKIRVWDISSKKYIQTYNSTGSDILSVNYSRDGTKIVSATKSDVQLWDVATGKIVFSISDGRVHAEFSPDDNNILSFGKYEGELAIWSAKTGKRICDTMAYDSYSTIMKMFYSSDGKAIVSESTDGEICIWDSETLKLKHILIMRGAHSVAVCSQNKIAYIQTEANLSKIFLWNDTGKEIKGNSIKYSPNGKYFVTLSDSTLKLYDASTENCLQEITGNNVFFSSDSKKIIYSKNGVLYELEISNYPRMDKKNIYNSKYPVVDISADGEKYISTSYDSIFIWNSNSQQLIKNGGHTDMITKAIFSKDGKYVVSSSLDNTVRIWEASTGQCLGIYNESCDVISIDFSPDGTYIVAGLLNNKINIWNIEKRECIYTLEGHSGWINSVSFSSDGRYILSTSNDGSIRVWDFATRHCIWHLPRYDYIVTDYISAIFSPDNQHIVAVSSHDDIIHIWDFPPLQKLINETRERFKDNPLTPEERRQYYLE